MTKLEELIQELCPDGVEFRKVKEVYRRLKGTPITAEKMKEIEDPQGEVKIFAGGRTVTNAKTEDIPNANITSVPAVLVQSRGVIDAIYYDKPFTFKNEMWAYTANETVSVKFLYHVLKNNIEHFRRTAAGMGSLPQIALSVTEDFKIPVPPLPVQREIVRILDNFTELTAKLTENLSRELTKRKQQYQYYWNKLFDRSLDGTKTITIAELGSWSGGKTPSMDNSDYWKNGVIPWITSKDMKAATLEDTEDHITEKAVSEAPMTVYPPNGIAVVTRSGILKHTLPVAFVPFEATVNQDIKMLIVDEGVLPRYAFHAIQGKSSDILAKTKKQGGTVDSLEFKKFLNYKIPLPPLETQKHLVEILDNFDAICTNLSSGLTSEIEARQKQYEYYRNKLLSFEEKV